MTQDDTVSAAYRQLANEQTPAHLDDKVLRMAANRARHPQYSRSVMWTRPLAWAATIALCLAITLEVTRTPAPEDEITLTPATKAESEVRSPAATVPEVDRLSQEQEIAPEIEKSAAPVAKKGLASQAFIKPTAADAQADRPARNDVEESIASPAPEFKARDAEMMQRAERSALQQSSSGNEPSNLCSDEARAAPESWLDCIATLEEGGAAEAAALEREALIEVYPDFTMP